MKNLCILLLLAISAGVYAQENSLTIDADFMTRGEIRAGGLVDEQSGESNYANFILERTLVGIGYENSRLQTRLTAQHCGTWGSSEGGYFNVYEAWVKFTPVQSFFAQIGRQNISYDDKRIFGKDDWAMNARSHDALRVGYEGHGHKVHLIAAYNQNPVNTNGGTYFTGGLQPYKSMQALWYHYDIPAAYLGLSALFTNVGMQGGVQHEDEQVFYQQMAGTYISFKPKQWNVEAAYYHQMGREENGLPLNAFMWSLKASFTPVKPLSIYGGYDFLSGDKYFVIPAEGTLGMVRHDVVRGFSSLYGSHHKFYGAMDFFYVKTYYRGFTPGLQNIFLGTKWNPVEKLSLDASFHYLATATKLDGLKQSLGYEAEFAAVYNFYKEAKISTGFSYMRGTETMETLKRTTSNRQLMWGWIMLSVTPKFFSGKW